MRLHLCLLYNRFLYLALTFDHQPGLSSGYKRFPLPFHSFVTGSFLRGRGYRYRRWHFLWNSSLIWTIVLSPPVLITGGWKWNRRQLRPFPDRFIKRHLTVRRKRKKSSCNVETLTMERLDNKWEVTSDVCRSVKRSQQSILSPTVPSW